MFSGIAFIRPVNARQAEKDDIHYVEADKVRAILSINAGGDATVYGKVKGDIIAQRIVVMASLQKYSNSQRTWLDVKSWSLEQKTHTVTISKKYKLTSKGTYRVKVTGMVYTSKGSENVSAVSVVKSY